jgi:hypothetical protein
MPRKLKVYQTFQGFYDLAIAAPSMKAALEAWGSNMNLFHQGFASEARQRRRRSRYGKTRRRAAKARGLQ